MSISKEINVRGKVTYWTLGSQTDAEALRKELEILQLSKFAPDNNTNKASLKIALERVCGNRRRLVRPLPAGERGYAIVTETKDQNGKSLDHSVDFDALLPDGMNVPIFRDPETGAILNPPEEANILHRYNLERDRCSSHKLGIALARIVDGLHGVSLRPTGGFYWIPEGALEKWNAVGAAIERCSSDRSNIVYSLKTAMDESMKRAVIDGLSRELSGEIATMEESVLTDDLGKRALKTKQERCERLRSRVIGYKKMFQVSLSSLEDSLERVESAVSLAALSGMGGI